MLHEHAVGRIAPFGHLRQSDLLETQRTEAGTEVELAGTVVHKVPRCGKKLEEKLVEEERARLGK